MWLLLRFLTLAAVWVWRFLWRHQSGSAAGEVRGVPAWEKIERRKGRFQRAFHGLDYSGPLRFRLTTERCWDRFFKDLGLAVEQQTGDEAFDSQVYLTCDQPALAAALRDDPAARRAVQRLFDSGVERVFADGAALWAEIPVEHHSREAVRESLFTFRSALERAPDLELRPGTDPFVWKAFAAEALIWSLVLYGLPGFLELTWKTGTVYVDSGALIGTGMLVSVGVFAVLFGATFVVFRGSSRGHRILVESFAVLLLGAPFSTVQAVSDINLHLDSSPPEVVTAQVERKSIETRRRRRHSSRHYYLHLTALPVPGALPGRLEVSLSTYHAVPEGGRVTARVRSGRLGFRWIESVGPQAPG